MSRRYARYAIAFSALGGCLPSSAAIAADGASGVAEVQFDSSFLMKGNGQRIDVSRYERGNPVQPGEYLVDVQLNGRWIGASKVRFAATAEGSHAVPCFEQALIEQLGLNTAALSEDGRAELVRTKAGGCADLARIAPSAGYSFDLSGLHLDLSIPQIALLHNPRGYVSPEFWDAGLPSATLGYNFNAFRTGSGGQRHIQAYLGLIAGLNLGSWHLRHNGSASWQSNGRDAYQNTATYLQHDIPIWRSQLTLGDTYTDGALFDSIGVRGVSLATDDRMLPESLRGYAPVIRGVATSNAHVKITQNGNTLYEINVAPGEFRIDDLNPTGYGGDLQVTVTEADGSQHRFAVPYAAVPQTLRPGITRFQLTAGELRDTSIRRHANLVQATAQRGISNLFTGYAGVLAATGYRAGLLGGSVTTAYGALGLDVTHAKADIPRTDHTSGQSLRLSFSKLVASTDTNITLAAYRYSSQGYWSARDALYAREMATNGDDPQTVYRQRNQFQLSVNQTLGARGGNLYAVGSAYDYWNRRGTQLQFQLGYNNFTRLGGLDFSYNLSLSRQRDGFNNQLGNQFFASVSMPLGHSPHSPMLSANYNHNDNGGSAQMLNLGGSLGENNVFSYGVNAVRAAGSYSGGGNVQYRSPYATLFAGASGGAGSSQQSLGMSGAVVAHPGGVTLTNILGDTMAVVEAKGAEGARINNVSGLRVDARGYAVVPYLTPYAMNNIVIDPKGLPLDVELQSTSEQVAPRANAVVAVRFATVSGRAVLIALHMPGGAAPPFGADVYDAQGNHVGSIGQGGRLFARGLPASGRLTATWGKGDGERCAFDYRLPAESGKEKRAYTRIDVRCDGGDVTPTASSPAPSAPKPLAASRILYLDQTRTPAPGAPTGAIAP